MKKLPKLLSSNPKFGLQRRKHPKLAAWTSASTSVGCMYASVEALTATGDAAGRWGRRLGQY